MKGAEAAAGGGVALLIIITVVMVVLLVYANRKRWRGRVAPDPPRRAVSGLLFAGVSSILGADIGLNGERS